MSASRVMAYGVEIFCALFVLFLVAATQRMSARAVELDLVQVGDGEGLVRPDKPHVLQVLPTGACLLDDREVAAGDLAAALQPGRPVVLAYEFQEPARRALEALYAERVPVLLAVQPTPSDERTDP